MSDEKRRFKATATHDGRWFVVKIHDLPRNCVGVTQGKTAEEAHSMAVEATALLLDVPESEVEIDLTFTPPTDVVIGEAESE